MVFVLLLNYEPLLQSLIHCLNHFTCFTSTLRSSHSYSRKNCIPYYYFFSIYMLNIELLIWLSFGLRSWFKSFRIFTIHRVCDFNIWISFLRFKYSVLYIVQLIWIPYFLSCGPRRKTHNAGFGQVRRAPPSHRGKFITYLSSSWFTYRLAYVVNK